MKVIKQQNKKTIIRYYEPKDNLVEISNNLLVFDEKTKEIKDKTKWENYLKKHFPNLEKYELQPNVFNGKIDFIAIKSNLLIKPKKETNKNTLASRLKYFRKYQKKNKEKLKAYRKKYYQKNKEKIKAINLKYYANHRIESILRNRKYKKKNANKIKWQKLEYYDRTKNNFKNWYKKQKANKTINLINPIYNEIYKPKKHYKYEKFRKN